MYVCLWSPGWSTDGASAGESPADESSASGASAGGTSAAAGLILADLAPRLRVEREVIWADARGLDAAKLAGALIERLSQDEIAARAGISAIPIAAELSARLPAPVAETALPFLVKERSGWGHRVPSRPRPEGGTGGTGGLGDRRPAGATQGGAAAPPPPVPRSPPPPVGAEGVAVVEGGGERKWLARLPITVLSPDARLATLLDGVGIRTVGELAALEREAVEVRFGAAAVALWRLARADDRRVLFHPVPPERPHGSIDFVDYVLTDPSRLLFTANALLGPLCDRLVARGEHARALRLVLPLANDEAWERTIRPARPTASRDAWLRLIRGLLERLTVPDAVAGMRLEIGATEPAGVHQGDLFDRGFATASAVEAAVARLAERNVAPLVAETNGHPLVERRASFELRASSFELRKADRGESRGQTGLALQLLAEPRRLLVEAVRRRDHEVPVRLRDRGGWREVTMAAGPDRISGGRWEPEPYAREYYRCVTDEGVLLWVYRDGRHGEWYLHGWWD